MLHYQQILDSVFLSKWKKHISIKGEKKVEKLYYIFRGDFLYPMWAEQGQVNVRQRKSKWLEYNMRVKELELKWKL